MKIEHFFPPCPLPECPQTTLLEPHFHVAPVVQSFFTYPEVFQYIQGGVGSGKTTGVAALIAMLSLAIPGNEAIIFRKDFGLNYKSSWKAFQQCIQQLVDLGYIPPPRREVKKQGEYTKYTLHNDSVIYAGQTKNISEYMGPDYGLIWVDDAMESPVTIFLGEGTVGGLQSRLRGAKATYSRYNGATVDLRRFFITTNPPPGISPWWDLFGKSPGVRYFPGSTTKYRHTQIASAMNPFLPPDYIDSLKANHTADEIARILEGKSVVYYGGRPVYQGYFNIGHHVSSFLYDVTSPLLISWDFGFQHPAITFSQIRQCPFEVDHIITLKEIAHRYNLTTWELYDEYKHYINLFYAEHEPHLIYHCCDISGFSKSASNKDKRGHGYILQDEYGLDFIKRRFDVEYSLQFMGKTLQDRCKCGYSRILIDRECPFLIEAYTGGYNYPKKRDGTYNPKPCDDSRFEDIADSHRYAVENFLRYGIPYQNALQQRRSQRSLTLPHEWMEDLQLYRQTQQEQVSIY